MQSQDYAKNLKLKYTKKTETNVSKLYRACIRDYQGKLVAYLLRNNPTLFNLRLTLNTKERDAFSYPNLSKEPYVSEIWTAFGEP